MLPELSQRVSHTIPSAVKTPIPDYHAYYYLSRLTEGLTDVPDFVGVETEYRNACLSFTYLELMSLSGNEFLLLQQQIQQSVQSVLAANSIPIPAGVRDFIIPGSKKNILIHEKEHIRALPVDIQNETRIDVVMQTDTDGNITIVGISVWDKSKTTVKQEALAFSEPQSLSDTDITVARSLAQESQDPQIIKSIEQRIRTRNKH